MVKRVLVCLRERGENKLTKAFSRAETKLLPRKTEHLPAAVAFFSSFFTSMAMSGSARSHLCRMFTATAAKLSYSVGSRISAICLTTLRQTKKKPFA